MTPDNSNILWVFTGSIRWARDWLTIYCGCQYRADRDCDKVRIVNTLDNIRSILMGADVVVLHNSWDNWREHMEVGEICAHRRFNVLSEAEAAQAVRARLPSAL